MGLGDVFLSVARVYLVLSSYQSCPAIYLIKPLLNYTANNLVGGKWP